MTLCELIANFENGWYVGWSFSEKPYSVVRRSVEGAFMISLVILGSQRKGNKPYFLQCSHFEDPVFCSLVSAITATSFRDAVLLSDSEIVGNAVAIAFHRVNNVCACLLSGQPVDDVRDDFFCSVWYFTCIISCLKPCKINLF